MSDETLPPQRDEEDSSPEQPTTDRVDHDATIAPTGQLESQDAHTPQIEGYELLKVLGRGGMGVVYKARNTKLDRLVALKMILGGQFASEEEVQRFKHEAESVARLDHPGIVPIYEVGDSSGHHYFSMKLIEGGSLSDHADTYREDHRSAAQLMIEIARAVSHAHQRGILHRDLKPANILIDLQGNPHITDLGLAKQLDDDSGMTKTGSVMGSPGFMSPEQAAGKTDVTTSVDVYSLGAIFYWLISGRPPIEGESHLDVILKTISEEPSSVQTYAPGADRDLNLICQKALAKKPEDRYESASAFASDLEAWLDGGVLSVKPPTAVDVVRIWMRRNARTVSISSTLGLVCGGLVGGIIFLLIVSNMLGAVESNHAQFGDASGLWVKSYFGWVSNIPQTVLFSLPPLIVLITVAMGIVLIRLVQPKSREVGMVAATTSALLAGIVAFTISLGWSPIITHSVEEGRSDISLLSEAIWLEESDERDLATHAMLKKYPGLGKISPEQRGDIVLNKILLDQSLGIPKGMWTGIATTMCLGVLPLFFSALFSTMVWQKGARGFDFFGKSIELAIYGALLFLLLTKYVSIDVGFYPGFWFQLLTCAGVATTLVISLLNLKWPWRLLGFALANLCVFSNMYVSERVKNPGRAVVNATTTEDYVQAAGYFEQRLRVSDQEYTRYLLAILYAFLEDDAKYQFHCGRLLKAFQNAHRPNVAERLAKAHLLKLELLDNPDVIHELAEIASGYRSSRSKSWLFLCRALSEYRKGNHESVLIWNRDARKAVTASNLDRPNLISTTWLIDAFALRELGRTEEANRAFETAEQIVANGPKGSWQDRFVYQVLRREW